MTGNGSGLTGGTNPAVFVGATDTGRAQKTTDPRGLIAKGDYDLLGHTTQTVTNLTDGVLRTEENITTQYSYDGEDHVVLLTAVQPAGGIQETQYNYGYSTTTISSNDLLASVQYPDKTSGLPSTVGTDQEHFQYDTLEQRQHTDRAGNVHAYSFDVLGRLTTDKVTTLGSGVAPAVQRRRIGKNREESGNRGRSESAGKNRHGVADERAAQERSSDPSWPRVMRRWS
jgi:YD repeat-containing protein